MRRFLWWWWPTIIVGALSVYYGYLTVSEIARGTSWWIGAFLLACFVSLTVREVRRTRHEQTRDR